MAPRQSKRSMSRRGSRGQKRARSRAASPDRGHGHGPLDCKVFIGNVPENVTASEVATCLIAVVGNNLLNVEALGQGRSGDWSFAGHFLDPDSASFAVRSQRKLPRPWSIRTCRLLAATDTARFTCQTYTTLFDNGSNSAVLGLHLI
jgi:hypothetical protein